MAVPYTTPIPGVGTYGMAAANADKAYKNTLAKINAQRSQTLRQYGYLGDINPDSGEVTNLRVDPYNQYGGLQQMLRSNADAAQQAAFDSQERGLHGGLAHKADSALKYQFGQQSSQLGQDLSGTLGDLAGQQQQASFDKDSALYQAELDAARNTIDNGDFNPADFSDVQDPGYGPDANAVQPTGPYTTGGVKHPALPNINKLIPALVRQGIKPSTWARQHPAAAAQLGISPKLNQNNSLIRTVMARTKAKKKGGR